MFTPKELGELQELKFISALIIMVIAITYKTSNGTWKILNSTKKKLNSTKKKEVHKLF
jgi:hypothetical protein